jgi:hypothetical protein
MKAVTVGIIIGLGASVLFASAGLIYLPCRPELGALHDDRSMRTERIPLTTQVGY